jgi:hypothetical protein
MVKVESLEQRLGIESAEGTSGRQRMLAPGLGRFGCVSLEH